MITVTVIMIGDHKRKSNNFSVNLNKEQSLGDLLKSLNLEIYEDGKPRSDIVIMINGRNIYFLNGLDTKLKHGDVVLIMPIVVGG
jgi:molybdopterin converting factor small subunit